MIASPDRTPPPRNFSERPVLEVAPDPLGGPVVRATPDGRITPRPTEAEAHDGPKAPGSPTFRTSMMFGSSGHVRVCFPYGMSRRTA
ncbi:DNA-3-methyladenine glycosylase [Streptomyces sp. NPDC003522]